MPVYRIRDGKETLSKNDEIFIRSADVLHDRKHLCLMPEGNHGDKRRLRPLVKGLFRIAFMAQEEFKAEKGVVIIPVGLDYSHYFKIRHDAVSYTHLDVYKRQGQHRYLLSGWYPR